MTGYDILIVKLYTVKLFIIMEDFVKVIGKFYLKLTELSKFFVIEGFIMYWISL